MLGNANQNNSISPTSDWFLKFFGVPCPDPSKVRYQLWRGYPKLVFSVTIIWPNTVIFQESLLPKNQPGSQVTGGLEIPEPCKKRGQTTPPWKGRSNLFLGLFETRGRGPIMWPSSASCQGCSSMIWSRPCLPCCFATSKRRPGRWQCVRSRPPVRSSTETCLRPRRKYDMNHEIHVYFLNKDHGSQTFHGCHGNNPKI